MLRVLPGVKSLGALRITGLLAGFPSGANRYGGENICEAVVLGLIADNRQQHTIDDDLPQNRGGSCCTCHTVLHLQLGLVRL